MRKRKDALALIGLSTALAVSSISVVNGEVLQTEKRGAPVTITLKNGEDVVADEFTVRLPKKLTASKDRNMEYTVSVSGILQNDHVLNVVPSDKVTLTTTDNDIALESTITQDKVAFTAEELEVYDEVETKGKLDVVKRVDNGDINEVSGSYTGNMIFTISVDDDTTNDEPEVKQYGLFDDNGGLIKSWDELIADGDITVILDDTVNGHSASLSGDLIIPDSITYIGNEALASSNLTSVTLSDSIKSIGSYAFMNCKSLVSTNIPDGITRIGTCTFANCKSLTSIDIPNSVTSIGQYAFQDCSALTSVTIPDSVTSIDQYAFSGCSKLTSLTIPDSVTTIGIDAFSKVKHIEYHGTATGSPWGALSIN